MERVGALDAWLLALEDEVTHLHLGSTAIFEGPTPSFPELRRMVVGKLPLVPRYRERVRRIPLVAGRPVWAPDPHFNIDYHLRHTGLPSPGSREQLHNLIGRVMARRLDMAKPLWEMWLVEGLEGGRWALIAKVHHALVDGITGTSLLSVLLDDSPQPSPPVPDTWRPPPEPSGLRLAGEAVIDYLVSPYEHLRAARALRGAPRALVRRTTALVRGAASEMGLARTAPASSLVGPIGPHRRYAWARASLADVNVIRRAVADGDGPIPEATVNDVILAAITQGFRALLLAHGEPPEERVVRSLVPISVRRPDERGTYSNHVSAVVAGLPVDVADPVERLRIIHEQMAELTATGRAVAADTLATLSGFTPPLLLALGTRVATRAAHRMSANIPYTIITNAPGPTEPVYALGRPMVEAVPCPAIAAPARVGVAVYSYNGQLAFGATGDWDSVPDVEVLCAGVEAGVADLLSAATAVADPQSG